MKKILFVADVRNWAYDDAAKNWKHLLMSEYDIRIIYLNDYPRYNNEMRIFDHESYDGILFFYNRVLKSNKLKYTEIPDEKIILCINNEKWRDCNLGAEEEFKKYDMQRSKILVGCNNTNIEAFKPFHNNILRASQSINSKVFYEDRKNFVRENTDTNIILGWSGNPDNELKNISFIKKACENAGVVLKIVGDLNRKELNRWYNKIDALIMCSISEGGPLNIMEAGSCGLPVIATPVGLVPEIIRDGSNGLIIQQDDIDGCVEAIYKLTDYKFRKKLGSSLQYDILTNWTYEARIDEIKTILDAI